MSGTTLQHVTVLLNEAVAAAGEDAQATLSGLGYTGTDPVEADWEWSCPEHRSERWPARGPCPTCGSPPLLVGRRAETK